MVDFLMPAIPAQRMCLSSPLFTHSMILFLNLDSGIGQGLPIVLFGIGIGRGFFGDGQLRLCDSFSTSAASPAFAAGPDMLAMRLSIPGSRAPGWCLTASTAVSGGREHFQCL